MKKLTKAQTRKVLQGIEASGVEGYLTSSDAAFLMNNDIWPLLEAYTVVSGKVYDWVSKLERIQ